jgi:hypothetical protein
MLEIDFSDRKIKNFQSKYQARVLIEQFYVILNFSVVFSTLNYLELCLRLHCLFFTKI